MANVIQAVDRLAGRIIGGLHNMLGVSYAEVAEHYVYQTTIATADAAAIDTELTGNIRITQDAAFICTHVAVTCRVDDTGHMVGVGSVAGAVNTGFWPDIPCRIGIHDQGSDRQLHNASGPLAGVLVDAGLAYASWGFFRPPIGKPRLLRPNSNIVVTIRTLKVPGSGTGFDFRVQLIGFKVYDEAALKSTMREPPRRAG